MVDEQPQTIAAIERAADVLSLFADSGERSLGVTEVATTLGLSKAVVYRILSSFRVKGYIDLDAETRRYRLGQRSLQLGMAYLDHIDIRSLARPELEQLSEAADETATLSVRSGSERIYVDQVTPDRDVKMEIRLGRAVPLHAGASSKAFLAFLAPRAIDEYLAGHTLDQLTDMTITTEKKLRAELTAVRERGYATSQGERLSGAASVAAPILSADAEPVAVMSVSGPRERFGDRVEEMAPMLLAAVERLSVALGHAAA